MISPGTRRKIRSNQAIAIIHTPGERAGELLTIRSLFTVAKLQNRLTLTRKYFFGSCLKS